MRRSKVNVKKKRLLDMKNIYVIITNSGYELLSKLHEIEDITKPQEIGQKDLLMIIIISFYS